MKINNVKSNIKIYAKILSFVCIFWLIAAGWYYFIPYSSSMVRFVKITNRDIPRYMFYIESIKFSLHQMRWLPIVLLPCTIFLFYWISGKVKIENTTNNEVKRKEIPNKVKIFEARETIEPKTSETKQGKETFDRKKTIKGTNYKI